MLESHVYVNVEKACAKCELVLKEEEIISLFSRNMNEYDIQCPQCNSKFKPTFTVYSEFSGIYGLKGRQGKPYIFLSPLNLYKEFTNLIKSKGANIVLKDLFVKEHDRIFWNMFLYFKMMRLPFWVLDQDFTEKHI